MQRQIASLLLSRATPLLSPSSSSSSSISNAAKFTCTRLSRSLATSSAGPSPPPTTQQDAPSQPKPKPGTSAFDIDTSASPLHQLLDQPQPSDRPTDSTRPKPKGGASRSMSSIEKRRQNTSRLFGLALLSGLGFATYNLGRDWDDKAEWERFKDSPLAESFLGRLRLRAWAMYEDFNNPVWEKLLPDPLPYPYGRPYTLVIDVDDLLVHSTWTRENGWRTAKRPGLDYFLGYLSQWYEIVIFTTQPAFTAQPIIEKLDPDRRYIAYTLFRESCKNVDGKFVKDLDFLNRDKSKVVVLDTNPDSFLLQPENGILIQPWKGERSDRELAGLIPFFESIGIYGIEDVRTTIKAYEGTHIPTEHAKREREIKQRQLEEWQAKRDKLVGLRGGLFGGIRPSSGSSSDQPPKTFIELERERFQQGYLEDQKFWKENAEAFRKQAKEDQERQLKEMKLSAWSFLTGQGLKPPGQEQAQS
ncbi:NIF-domain-containing protein [Violaceomyces palustris]|uniref:NIF-domain-containing protein n=1 Tax=Violaceomyces palustris TaxID=1673888 RepID=A0ACD0P4L0_9BASI|nr:NIF-domain-containing protein [Violaceomyces palustris]